MPYGIKNIKFYFVFGSENEDTSSNKQKLGSFFIFFFNLSMLQSSYTKGKQKQHIIYVSATCCRAK